MMQPVQPDEELAVSRESDGAQVANAALRLSATDGRLAIVPQPQAPAVDQLLAEFAKELMRLSAAQMALREDVRWIRERLERKPGRPRLS
jgi:hypothetical protein